MLALHSIQITQVHALVGEDSSNISASLADLYASPTSRTYTESIICSQRSPSTKGAKNTTEPGQSDYPAITQRGFHPQEYEETLIDNEACGKGGQFPWCDQRKYLMKP